MKSIIPKHPECKKRVAQNFKKGWDEKELKLKWGTKAGEVLVLMRKFFNNHNSGCKILTKLLTFFGLNFDY